jgi:hypothetical protein
VNLSNPRYQALEQSATNLAALVLRHIMN